MLVHFCQVEHSAGAVGDWVFRLSRVGRAGVDLFFVLSGFLITGVLLAGRKVDRPLRTFWIRRALRILPLYYLVVVALLLLPLPRWADLHDVQPWYWLHGVNLLITLRGFGATPPGTSHLWSLALEEQFYLVWPLVVLFLDTRVVAKVALTALVLSVAARTGLSLSYTMNADTLYAMPLLRLDGLLLGALLRLGWERAEIRARMQGLRWITVFVGLAGLMAIVLLSGSLRRDSRAMTSVGLLFVAVCATGLVMMAASDEAPERGVVARVLSYLGRRSYAIYLVHYPLLAVLHYAPIAARIAPHDRGTLGRALLLLTIVTLGSVAIAQALWHLIEAPALRLKSRVPYRRRRSAPHLLIPAQEQSA
jgi:peptidoglycan/LPS O-acetylase OafA/YrhL